MNKITLTLKPTHLKAVIDDYYNANHLIANDRITKLYISIADDLIIKLERKLITKRSQKQDKEFKMTLKYYEALAFLQICKFQFEQPGAFEQNTYRLIIQQLDKQL